MNFAFDFPFYFLVGVYVRRRFAEFADCGASLGPGGAARLSSPAARRATRRSRPDGMNAILVRNRSILENT